MTDYELLKKYFEADFLSGIVRHRTRSAEDFATTSYKASHWNKRFAGMEAGSAQSAGYLRSAFRHLGRAHSVLNHHIVWTLYHGRPPEHSIDHKDRCRTNNAIVNLREATGSQQNANRKSTKEGLKGAYRNGSRWCSRIRCNARHYWLGQFETEEEAHEAYKAAAFRLHGEFATYD